VAVSNRPCRCGRRWIESLASPPRLGPGGRCPRRLASATQRWTKAAETPLASAMSAAGRRLSSASSAYTSATRR